ncbi:protein-glutamate methylesterase/protein-glutamine glutaminase [Marinomonas mediterranea]|jgi:Chemotaxis response regulator containing a CheY-like receiver domain and a methylesterase domain|uniref:Protein-glutamate methylesterase/protein-glutamine glutaminase n=1 Tax=Marinomonas mediterranea (strain ATCC 700492 / JCM 21426 / NBRC 103028 / MMB-1) TaxID=717774 RepID=F2K3J0_MARM1|nr:chemotaxis response regulator protein-glutamate methylesterase [Marinomonas mediterranea]ADZ92429.1 response regulator receiver modulated CheB methylesterase [Marinomonas mediterranea MMB-1]WCN10381.1 chemotaxis-specific protein-glutamate methyltransferase CheB [Marinomonas mediterranea]WCN14427.1 chemotaxis-specific protein-glutamate methyltransferase CheB [Marinomonas mediterranea]WCN18479.1 chemotaxis-specific protein-glutamate methyltransferase CheB [Marinomonas mediterranea MMB-1]
MPVKVLVVDDSGFFRRRLVEIFDADPRLKVIGTANNGKEAVEKVQSLSPDVVTMDYEMPVLDGISAVTNIMKLKPTPVLMFSSLTHEGAQVTLDALEAGAVDFMPKNFEDISRDSAVVKHTLVERVITVARTRLGGGKGPAQPVAKKAVAKNIVTERGVIIPRARKKVGLVAIGTSTGGPMALQTVLKRLPKDFPVPLVLVQHMPAAFTHAFAERLNHICQIQVKEAQDGDKLQPGVALLAPGGKQMMVDPRNGGCVRILQGDERLNYKPSVDVTFGSASKCYPGKVLSVVMTGMGADGREGARMLKDTGSRVWVQSEDSCVIYGMPMAVEKANLADDVIHLDHIGDRIIKEVF